MWCISWVIHNKLIHFLFVLIFTKCVISKKSSHKISLEQHLLLVFLFQLIIFSFPTSGLLSLTILGTIHELLPILIHAVTVYIAVYVFLTVHTVMVYLTFVINLLLWLDITQMCHIPMNWSPHNTFYSYFYYFWLYCAFNISYLADNSPWIILVSNRLTIHIIFTKYFKALFEFQDGCIYLKYETFFTKITLNRFVIAHSRMHIFTVHLSMYAVSVQVTG